MNLKDPDLLRRRAYVNGRCVDAAGGPTHEVLIPANGRSIGTVPDLGVSETIASKYHNTGQPCVRANRNLVHSRVHDKFTHKLIDAVSQRRVGDGLRGSTDQGPLVDAPALAKVEEHLPDAIANRARIVHGGRRHALGGNFFEPAIVTDATTDMLFAREGTFGPVAPIFRFNTEEDAIRLANAAEFGLAAYFYARDLARGWRAAAALECRMVGFNTGLISTEVAPIGGIKESGIGHEGSKYGILDYTEMKYVCMGGFL